MSDLKLLVEGYQNKNYKRVQRNNDSYSQTLAFTVAELERLVSKYNEQFEENQTARLIRDSIDHHIRRYHGYCIEGAIGSHYREIGVDIKECVFEHVIPASSVRDMLIQGRLSIIQALNTPTCLIKKNSDVTLRESGLSSTSPSNWYFFRRYEVLQSKFETYNGQPITDMHSMTLEDHFKLFGV
jgi:hypothetical protein